MEKAFLDPNYASKLENQTAAALEELGVKSSPERVAAVKSVFGPLREAYTDFGYTPMD
jgi:hypothetical protein